LVVMGDPVWLCLFRADFTEKDVVKGNLRVKVKIDDIKDVSLDKVEQKKLNMDIKVGGWIA